jgi:hypothetical protein
MKILVHGDKEKHFFAMDSIREPYYANIKHEKNNIDFLRPWWCELTALYYVLNNYNDTIIGIEQYRRYLLNNEKTAPLNETEINSLLLNYDIICGKERYPSHVGRYIYCWPINTGKKFYFEIYLDVLNDMFGKEMSDFFRNFLYGIWHCHGNLMIGKRQIIKEYMDFLINTFDEFKKRIDLRNTIRSFEYISEFLFGAWLTYNNYKIYFSHWMNCGRIIE